MKLIRSFIFFSIMTLFAFFVLLGFGCETNTTEMTDVEVPLINDELTLAGVSQHNSEEDCWLLVDNKLYDVTKFIPSHPGGKAILTGCGKDATSLFDSRHDDGSRAFDLITEYYIGDLTQ